MEPDKRVAQVKPARVAFLARAIGAAAFLGLLGSCAFFSRPPALPRHAAIESRVAPKADDKYDPLIENADIIYFPAELVGPPQRSEPAWKLAEALHRHGRAFVVGWDALDADEQSLLDQWGKGRGPENETLAQLHLSGGAGDRENCRAFLRESRKFGARFLALRKPRDLRAAAPAEEAAFQAEEFAAEKIAEQFRERRSEKLLVFLQRRHLGDTRGVPYLVAQKVKARQLVLDSREHPSGRTRLFAFVAHRGGIAGKFLPWIARRFQIVNRAPVSAGDQL